MGSIEGGRKKDVAVAAIASDSQTHSVLFAVGVKTLSKDLNSQSCDRVTIFGQRRQVAIFGQRRDSTGHVHAGSFLTEHTKASSLDLTFLEAHLAEVKILN